MLRFLVIERPTTQTRRSHATAASMTSCSRWMCDANEVTITRPGASRTMRFRLSATTASEGVVPSRSALVESPSISATPVSPTAPKRCSSVRRPSIGVWSILMSPVCTMVPSAVCSTTATASGMECVTRMNSARNGPTWTMPLAGSISRSSDARMRPCSSSFDLIMPSVRRVAHTSGTPTSRIRYGRPPT